MSLTITIGVKSQDYISNLELWFSPQKWRPTDPRAGGRGPRRMCPPGEQIIKQSCNNFKCKYLVSPHQAVMLVVLDGRLWNDGDDVYFL